jgi:hypothetical protein
MGDLDEGSQESMAIVAPVSLDRFKVKIKQERKIAVVKAAQCRRQWIIPIHLFVARLGGGHVCRVGDPYEGSQA